MPFKDGQEVRRYMSRIFEVAFGDDELGARMAATGIVVRFTFTAPDADLVIDMGGRRVCHQPSDSPTPSATMTMSADTANGYWQGKVNLPVSMARGRITVEGNLASLLKLAPLGKRLYPVYIQMLTDDDRQDLLV